MEELSCPKCQHSPLERGAKVCPNCGAALPRRGKGSGTRKKRTSTQIQVDQKVGEVQAGGQVTGVQIGQVSGEVIIGYSAAEVGQLLDQISAQLQPKAFDGSCPYVGLDAFQEEDADRFFGRERLVGELVSRLQELHFLAVAGPSGSGKSSLVRAGLIPALKRGALDGSAGWLYTSMTPGRAPLESLGKALSVLSGNLQPLNDFRQTGEKIPATVLQDWAEVLLGDQAKRRLVLVIDQFEELFTQLGEADAGLRSSFLQQITHASAAKHTRLLIILTLRSDFVSNCAAYPQLNSLLNQGFFQVGPMAPDELVSAIARPALQVGLRIEPELVSQVVADMRQEPGALPLMQFALQDLFEYEKGKGGVTALTLDGYLERGGLHRALARYADDAFTHLNAEEQKLAESIFRGLVQPGRGTQDARRTALFEELTPAGADRDMVEAVIRRLADARLITTDDRPETPEDDRTVTLAHERLLEAWPWLHRLVDENREAIVLQVEIEQDAQRWESNQRDESYLYSGARLATVQEHLEEKKLALSGGGAAFIAAAVEHKQAREKAEREAREAEQRRELEAARRIAEEQKLRAEAEQRRASIQRRMLQIVGSLLVIAIALTVWAMIAQGNANKNFQEAFEQAGTATAALGISYVRGTEAAQQRQLADANAKEALHQANLALSRQLAAQALTELVQGNQAIALKLAAHAYRISDTSAARSALLTGLQENPRLVYLFGGHQDYVLDLAAQPEGDLLASAGCGARDLSGEKCLFGEVRLWNLSSGKPDGEVLGEHGNAVRRVMFSPDGKLLASADDDGVINLWDVETRSLAAGPLAQLEGSPGFLSFSPDSSLLYAREQDGVLLAWDLASRRQLSGEAFPGLPADLRIGTLHPDGRTLAGRDERNFIQVWFRDSLSGNSRLQSTIDAFSLKESLGLLLGGVGPDPRLAISLENDLVVYSARTGERLTETLSGHQAQVRAMALAPDNQHLASASLDRTIRIWHLPSWPVRNDSSTSQQQVTKRDVAYAPLLGHQDNITSLDFAMQGKYLASGSRDMSVRVWDWQAEGRFGSHIYQADGELLSLRLSPDGKVIAYGGCALPEGENCRKGKVEFIDVESGRLQENALEAHNDFINAIAYHPDGSRILTGSWDGTFIIWDTTTLTPVAGPIAAHEDFVTDLAFSPNGERFASGSRDGSIKLWSTMDGSQVGQSLRGHEERVTAVAWSPQGDFLASAGRDANVLLWDISASPAVSATLEGHLEQVNNVQFSPDGRLLASSSADNSVIVWDVAARKLLMRLVGHADRSAGLAFSPDGSMLASGSWDDTIRLWDTSSGQPIGRPLTGHRDNVGGLAFSSDGEYLYSSSRDGEILRWDVSPRLWLQRACRIVVQELDAQEWLSLVGPGVEYAAACPP